MRKTIEEIKKNLENSVAENTALINAYKSVKRVYKKDGKPFVSLKRNFEGCSIGLWQYASHDYENRLTIYSKVGAKYVNDSIDLWKSLKYMKPEEIHHEPCPKMPCIEQAYAFDVDEIEQAIKDRIKYLEDIVKKDEEQLSTFDHDFKEAESKIKECIASLSDKMTNEMRDFIESNIWSWLYDARKK